MINLKLAKKVAIKAVKSAGKIVAEDFIKSKETYLKAPRDIVTEVDLKSEKLIINLISKNFPDHSLLSEEAGFIDKKSDYLWIMDPIDGTTNYIRGIDPFCVALCLLERVKPIISAIYMPRHKQLYFAAKGEGATLNGKKIKVSDKNIEDSLAVIDVSSKKDNQDILLTHLRKVLSSGTRMRSWASSLYALSMVSSGNLDFCFNFCNKIWDIMPAVLLIQEAGGIVTDINGQELTLKSSSVLATNGKIHQQVLSLLK